MRFGAAIPVMNEWRFMPTVVGQLLKVVDRVVILRSNMPMSGGGPVKLHPVPCAFDPRVEVLYGSWKTEHETRNAGMDVLSNCQFVFHVDSDEIFSEYSLRMLQSVCNEKGPQAIACRLYTYWKTTEFRIDPPEQLIAPVVIRCDKRFENRRLFKGEQLLINRFLMHHLSYVHTDEEIKEKLRVSDHAAEVVPNWFENVWKAWDSNYNLENLHPTNPTVYRRAVRVRNSELEDILREHGAL